MAKLYFYDAGLGSWLMGIRIIEQIAIRVVGWENAGQIFESSNVDLEAICADAE